MTKVKLESRNAILGFKKIAEMIIIAGIGKIYGENLLVIIPQLNRL